MKSRSTIVEFCGLPGAGKSHIAARVARALAKAGLPTRRADLGVSAAVGRPRRIGRKLTLLASETLARPRSSIAAMDRIVGSRQATWADGLSMSVQWVMTQALLDRARGAGGVHIFEEGVVQALWSIGLRGDAEGLLEALASGRSSWCRPDLVVVVDAPLDVVRERLHARGSRHSRTQRLDLIRRERELARGRVLLEELLAWSGVRAPVGQIRVANGIGGPSGEELARVVERVWACARDREPLSGSAELV